MYFFFMVASCLRCFVGLTIDIGPMVIISISNYNGYGMTIMIVMII